MQSKIFHFHRFVKLVILVFFLLSINVLGYSQGKFSLGGTSYITSTGNFDPVNSEWAPTANGNNFRVGAALGITSEYQLFNKLRLQGDLLLSPSKNQIQEKIQLTPVMLPILVVYKPFALGLRFKLGVQPDFYFNSNLSMGLPIGVGYDFGFGLGFDLRYVWNLGSFSNGNWNAAEYDRIIRHSFMVGASYRFRL